MGVVLLVVAVGDDHLGPHPADLGHEAPDRLVERAGRKGARVGVRGRARHARVAVAEHDQLVVADDLRRPGRARAGAPLRCRPGPRGCPWPG